MARGDNNRSAPFPKSATIITRLMWRNILGHSLFQFVVLSILLFYGAGTPTESGGLLGLHSSFPVLHMEEQAGQLGEDALASPMDCEDLMEDGDASERDCHAHYSCVFNAFVMMQLFNQINMRKVRPEERNPFRGLLSNHVFILVTLIEFILQWCIVQYGGHVFDTEGGLSLNQWALCVGLGVLVLPYHQLLMRITPHSWVCDEPPPTPQKGPPSA